MPAANKIGGIENNESIQKSTDLKNQKIQKTWKLSKFQKLAKWGKKLLKSRNLSIFGANRARLSF